MRLHHRLDGPAAGTPLLLGPSIGTSLRLWEPQLDALTRRHRVLRFDLPGHGGSPAVPDARTTRELAAYVLALADAQGWDAFAYAGVSLGGAIGARIAIDHPERVTRLALLASSADFGGSRPWLDRAELVRAEGTAPLLTTSPARWFADPAATADSTLGRALLSDLAAADPEGYARCCEAIADHDVTAVLGRIQAPTLVVQGRQDPATPPVHGRALADGIPHARLLELPGAAHLPGVDRPAAVTDALLRHFEGDPLASGFEVRRAVLGTAHVDRAVAAATPFTAGFQDLITRYAWGEIWTRPGLDRRTRSAVTLTALVAGGHEKELALHIRGALNNGLSRGEIEEVLLQTAVYCGVPAANSAFAVAQEVLNSIDEEASA
ncbi:4-carboxymuconolactone decarboxylase [Catenulispora subtropica]|uniref:3-oxoadipate enol-lactonase n=1 Tax=Catenulispora subtropica TaxID=450798 RepID=A0ABN2RIR2_9ACTN